MFYLNSFVAIFFTAFSVCVCLCPDGWVYFQHSCYLFSHDGKSFTESEHFCKQEHGAHLVKVETRDENIFLKSFCSQLKDNAHWIGLTDTDIEGIWQWLDGSRPAFTDWYPNEPNAGNGANCLALWIRFNYGWADEECSKAYRPICERPESSSEVIVG